MKKWLDKINWAQGGQVLPVVLVLLVVGTLVALPSLNYVQNSIKAGETIEENVFGLYAADSGIEDAFWRLKNEALQGQLDNGPITYDLTETVNGMNVTVTMQFPNYIGEERVLSVGTHQDWIMTEQSCTPNGPPGIGQTWTYTLNLIDWNSPKNFNVSWLGIDLQGGLDYLGPVTGNITTNPPTIQGSVIGGLSLGWGDPNGKLFTMQQTDPHNPITYTLSFQIIQVAGNLPSSNPVGVVYFYIQNEIKFVTSQWPYVVKATASNARGVQAEITAGVWMDDAGVTVRAWDIKP